jgi:hypothetical protein
LRGYREVMEIIANWIAMHYIEYKGWSEEYVTIEV